MNNNRSNRGVYVGIRKKLKVIIPATLMAVSMVAVSCTTVIAASLDDNSDYTTRSVTYNGTWTHLWNSLSGKGVVWCKSETANDVGDEDLRNQATIYCGNKTDDSGSVWSCKLSYESGTSNDSDSAGYSCSKSSKKYSDFESTKEKADKCVQGSKGYDASSGECKSCSTWISDKSGCENAGCSYSTLDDGSTQCIDQNTASVVTPDSSNGSTDSDSDSTEEDSCEASLFGFGWLLCNAVNLLEGAVNTFLSWIDSSLQWTLLVDNSDAIRTKWQDFLNLANIAFAIVFLIMIYSMATSTGLSNYDVKKMLPRLIVCAVAVNISFYICAMLVDISNIVGKGLYSLILGEDNVSMSWSIGAADLVGSLTEAAIIIGVVVIGVMFFGTAIMALVTIYIAIILRQVALSLLVIISPLAFVCYMLPNTQKWFQKWLDYFVRLLMVYPMFTAVWGSARWISTFMAQGTTEADIQSGTAPAFIIQFVCMIAPAVAIIPMFRASGGLMGRMTGAVAGGLGRTGLARKMDSGARNLGRRATAAPTRLAGRGLSSLGRGISNAAGRAGASGRTGVAGALGAAAGAVGGAVGAAAIRGGNKVAAAAQRPGDAIDGKAMDDAKTLNAGLSADQISSIINSGNYTDDRGRTHDVDNFRRRAAMEAAGGMGIELAPEQQPALLASAIATGDTRLIESAGRAVNVQKETSVVSNDRVNTIMMRARNGDYNGANGQAQLQADWNSAVAEKASTATRSSVSKQSSTVQQYISNTVRGTAAADTYSRAQMAAVTDDKTRHGMSADAINTAAMGAAAGVQARAAAATQSGSVADQRAAATEAESLVASGALGGQSLTNMQSISSSYRTQQAETAGNDLIAAAQSNNQVAMNAAASQLSEAYNSGSLDDDWKRAAESVGKEYANKTIGNYEIEVTDHGKVPAGGGAASASTKAGLESVSKAEWVTNDKAKGIAQSATTEINTGNRRPIVTRSQAPSATTNPMFPHNGK